MITVTAFSSRLEALTFEFLWNHPKQVDHQRRWTKTLRHRIEQMGRILAMPVHRLRSTPLIVTQHYHNNRIDDWYQQYVHHPLTYLSTY